MPPSQEGVSCGEAGSQWKNKFTDSIPLSVSQVPLPFSMDDVVWRPLPVRCPCTSQPEPNKLLLFRNCLVSYIIAWSATFIVAENEWRQEGTGMFTHFNKRWAKNTGTDIDKIVDLVLGRCVHIWRKTHLQMFSQFSEIYSHWMSMGERHN